MPDSPIQVCEDERPLRSTVTGHPQSDMWRVLRSLAQAREMERDEARQRVADAHALTGELAADVADSLHQVRQLVTANRHRLAEAGFDSVCDVLIAVTDRQEAALRRAGVRILDPVGEPFDDQIALWTEVRHTEPVAGLAAVVVTKTLRPGVLLMTGELISPALVVLGTAPPEEPPSGVDPATVPTAEEREQA